MQPTSKKGQANVRKIVAGMALIATLGTGAVTELRAQQQQETVRNVTAQTVNRDLASQSVAAVTGQPQKVKFEFSFVVGNSELVMQYGANVEQGKQLDTWVKQVAGMQNTRVDSVVVNAYYSPADERMGSTELAGKRIVGVRDYVLRVFEHNGLNGVTIGGNILSLKNVSLAGIYEADGNNLWEGVSEQDLALVANEYEKLRIVEFTLYLNAAQTTSPVTEVRVPDGFVPDKVDPLAPDLKNRQLEAIMTNPYPVWMPGMTKIYGSQLKYQPEKQPQIKGAKQQKQKLNNPVDPVFAIKTNIPYWLVLAPNAGIEFYMGKFSIVIEGTLSYWEKGTDTGDKGIYIAEVGPEFRYWLNEDRRNGSHFFGVYGQFGEFDVKMNETGRQGTGFGGGVSYGYYLPVGNRWAFEFGIGIGALKLKYDVYEWNDLLQKRLWVKEKDQVWFGPTKVKAAVIFRIGNNK